MPSIQKVFTLSVPPEKFLRACSSTELQEVAHLINSPYFQSRMNNSASKPNTKELGK